MLMISACATPAFGTGNIVTQEMDFEDFDEVEISDAFVVKITQGDEYRVILEVDEASLPYLDVHQRGDTLRIRLTPRTVFSFWNINLNSELRAEITMPNLVGLEAHDAARVTVSGFRTGDDVRLEVSDASTLEGDIESGDTRISASDASTIDLEGNRGDVDVEARDASRITLTGEGGNATIRVADASDVDMSEFPVGDASVEANDAGTVTVNVSGTLDAEATDGSRITYFGDPTIGTIRSTDDSTIAAR
jgi:hypothetical protein